MHPNLDADGGVSAVHIRGSGTMSPAAFARDATAYLRYLQRTYRERLIAGDDAGVLATARTAAIVERAALVHASARSLAIVRARSVADSPRAADTAAAKAYLAGVQSRLADALSARDVYALEAATDAADAAMQFLAEPEKAFADLAPRAAAAASLDARAAAVDARLTSNDEPEAFAMHMTEYDSENRDGASMLDAWSWSADSRRRRGCCGFSFVLTTRDRVIFFIYVIMVVAALVAVGFVTKQFIDEVRDPGSFLRATSHSTLEMPVVTLCLSRVGVPHSRLQVFNFTDGAGTPHRGADPQGDYGTRSDPSFRNAVERFWDNPKGEDCASKIGDYFPLSTSKLNALADGSVTSECRPCYRFGLKQAVNASSTDFSSSAFISAFTDNYALECFKRPGGLTLKSVEFLHKFIPEKVSQDVANFGILTRPGGTLVPEDFTKLNGKQLCNVFYFGLFPKVLKRLSATDAQIRYEYNGTNWNFKGTGIEFVPPKPAPATSDFFPLESLMMFVSTRKNVKRGTIKGLRDMVLIGPNTQTFASFRPLIVYKESRYDVWTSTSNFIDNDVTPLFGYWLNYRIFYNFNRFITDEYYKESTYTVMQWFVDFTGYLSLFTGASIFSLFLLPILYGMRAQQRKRERSENPEAYLLRKHRKNYAVGMDLRRAHSVADRSVEERVQLPGYNV